METEAPKEESVLNSKSVTDLFRFCLFEDSELTGEGSERVPKDGLTMIKVMGININAGFHAGRVAASTDKIVEMLNELPETFHEGWTFLNMCLDKQGRTWTGFHKVMQELMMLGMAAGRMAYCLKRDMWLAFPGSVPYVRILKPGETAPDWALGKE